MNRNLPPLTAQAERVLSLVRASIVETLDVCYDTITKANDAVTLLAWVEQQRMNIGKSSAEAMLASPGPDANAMLNSIMNAMLSNVTLALISAANERDRSLDSLHLYRNSVLHHFNEIAREDLRKWDTHIATAPRAQR